MAKKNSASASDGTRELLQDLIIIELGLAGVGQREIRKIVGVDMNRITRIVKLLPKRTKGRQEEKQKPT